MAAVVALGEPDEALHRARSRRCRRRPRSGSRRCRSRGRGCRRRCRRPGRCARRRPSPTSQTRWRVSLNTTRWPVAGVGGQGVVELRVRLARGRRRPRSRAVPPDVWRGLSSTPGRAAGSVPRLRRRVVGALVAGCRRTRRPRPRHRQHPDAAQHARPVVTASDGDRRAPSGPQRGRTRLARCRLTLAALAPGRAAATARPGWRRPRGRPSRPCCCGWWPGSTGPRPGPRRT